MSRPAQDLQGAGAPTWWIVFTKELHELWIGGRARASAARPLFLALNTQQAAIVRPVDVFGAAVMLLGMASWGVLAALLGS